MDEEEDFEAMLAEEEAMRMEQEMDQYQYEEQLMANTSTDAITPKASSSSYVPAVYTPVTPKSSVVLPNHLAVQPGAGFASSSASSKDSAALQALDQFASFSKTKAAPTTGSDLARRMRAERLAVLGAETQHSNSTNALSVNAFEAASKLATLEPLYLPLRKKEVYTCVSNIPPETEPDCATCIVGNGDRFFLPSRQSNVDNTLSSSSAASQSLLGRPIHDLIQEVDQMNVKAEIAKNLAINRRLALEEERDGLFDVMDSKRLKEERRQAKEDNRLWVDKYTPQSFTQLLSMEKTNREVLKALKRWDAFVFKRDVPAVDNSSNGEHGNNYDALDEDGRPKHKVILLCGPPGTGKTTLAHVCAKHCGYNTVEINASEDRSPEQLKELLSRATQSSTLDADKRPNCIIFDEIDGMDGNKQALEMLLEVIRAPLKANVKGGKHKTGVFSLTRPLLCICNDQYAPVLRELRKVSDIFVFQLPQDTRLVQRLKYICAKEKIALSQSANQVLTELVGATGHDIRSSINNLQFAALKLQSEGSRVGAGKDLTSVIESMMQMGLKDDQLDSFQVWQKIFVKNTAKEDKEALLANSAKKDHNKNHTSSSNSNKVRRESMMVAFDAMVDHGDMLQILSGIHENMHKVSSSLHQEITGGTVAVMNRHCKSSEWLSLCDAFYGGIISGNSVMSNTVSHHDGGVQSMNFVALMAAAAHYCHATNTAVSKQYVKLEWPKIDRDNHYLKVQRDNILQSVSELNSSGLWTISKERMVLDVISSFVDIIRPRVRPMPMVSLSPEEQALISHVAVVMESCNFSYVPVTVETTTFVRNNNKFFNNKGPNNNNNNSGGFGQKKGFGQGNYNPNNNNSNNNSSSNSNSKAKGNKGLADHSSVFLSESQISWVLDPNIELLVEFTDIEAMKEAAAAKNQPAAAFNSKRFNSGNAVSKKVNHLVLSEDIKNTIYMEQRKYAIKAREHKVASNAQSVVPADPAVVEKKAVAVKADIPMKPEAAMSSTDFSTLAPTAHGLSSFFTKRTADSGATSNTANKKPKMEDQPQSNHSLSNQSGNQHNKTAKKADVNFRFNQGYSNAVKRPVYIADFM